MKRTLLLAFATLLTISLVGLVLWLVWASAAPTLKLRVLLQPAKGSYPAQFSPDNKYLVTKKRGNVNNSGGVEFWDAATGKPLPPSLNGAFSSRSRIAFGPKSSVACYDPKEQAAIALDLPSGAKSAAFQLPRRCGSFNVGPSLWDSRPVFFSSNFKTLVMGRGQGTLVIADAATGEELLEIAGPLVDLSPDGSLAAVATIYNSSNERQPTVNVYDLESRKIITAFENTPNHQDFTELRFSPDGEFILTATDFPPETGNVSIELWDARTGRRLSQQTRKAALMAFTPDGKMARAYMVKGLEFWTVTKDGLEDLRPIEGIIIDSPDGTLAAVAPQSLKQPIEIVTVPDNKSVARIALPADIKYSRMEFTSDNAYIVIGGWVPQGHEWVERKRFPEVSSDVGIFDLANGKLVGRLNRVSNLVISPDGKSLATADDTGKVSVWDLPARR